MRFPRHIGGQELAKLVKEYGYKITRQTGSHIRLTTSRGAEHHITIPKHKPLKVKQGHLIVSYPTSLITFT